MMHKKISIMIISLIIIGSCNVGLASQAKSSNEESSFVLPSLFAAGVGLLSGYLAYSWYKQDSIKSKAEQEVVLCDYVPARDREELIKLFNDNSAHLGTSWSQAKALSNNRVVKVLDNKQQLVGFIMYRYQAATKYGIIDYMAIDKKYRRKGYGKKLVLHANDEFKRLGAEKVILSIKKADQATMAFYVFCGFREDKTSAVDNLQWMHLFLS